MGVFVDFMLVSGMVMNLIILFLLFRIPKKQLPQKILIVFFTYILLVIFSYYGDLHDIDLISAATFVFQDHVELVLGPLLLFYITSLFEYQDQFWRKSWYHFIPAVIYTVVISIPVVASIVQGRFVFTYLEALYKHELLLLGMESLFLLSYTAWSIQKLNSYTIAVKENYSNLKKVDLTWVKKFLWGVFITVAIDFVTNAYEIATTEFEWDTGFITMMFLVILIFYLGYYGTNQSKILLPEFLIESKNTLDSSSANLSKVKEISHHLSNASIEEIEILKRNLEDVMKYKKPYLDDDLTLGSLATLVETSDKKLSALLNHYMHTSFYDMINDYRVREVKSKMKDERFENFTLLALAFESGFKSKTSFNRIFKKITGASPSEYKKLLS